MLQRSRWLRWLIVASCILAQLAILPVAGAASAWERAPGARTTMLASDEEVQTFIAAPQSTYLRAQTAQISVEYQGFTPEAQAAFEYAVQIWESLLNAPFPIRIQAVWEQLPTGALGAAGPNNFFRTQGGPWYPAALAKQIANRDLEPNEPDIIASFNNTGVNWYFGTGQTPANQYSLALVVLHELGHGLGFTDSFDIKSGQGQWGVNGSSFTYDRFVIDADGGALIDTARYGNPSTALAGQLQSGQVFYGGQNTRAANGGNPARLYAPGTYNSGSSIAHFDEDTYPAGTPNSLMTPFGARGESNYNPGPLALAVLRDIGWSISDNPIPSPSPSSSPSPSAGGPQQCFPETGQCISGRFLTQWTNHGGLAINGYPLSGERQEKLEDGKTYLVQWFERVRMEYHPENTAPNDVLLGQFGRAIHPADPPVAEIPGQNFFPQTGHNVPNDFMAYWNANGGLPQFGFPLSEVITETLEDGKQYQVLYFERARFERHPENVAPYNVLLGQFGRRILNGGPAASPSPSPGGNILLQDNFNDPNSGWPTYVHPQGHYDVRYLPGEYRIALAAANYR
ncbi:MAG: hypothetical protein U0232_26340, partial [Thermomicrobiales bacterium]